jgi:hypothetical protein
VRTPHDELIHEIGESLARQLTGFWGSLRFSIQNGKYVNCNIEQSLKPEKNKTPHCAGIRSLAAETPGIAPRNPVE